MPDLSIDDRDRFLSLTAGLWPELRNQRLFITGGTGFVGSWLLESFLWANDSLRLGASATVLTRNPDAFRRNAPRLTGNPAIELWEGDVRSFVFPAGTFRFVIHAATDTQPAVTAGARLATLDAINEGTRRTLEFSRQRGVQGLLLTSSGAVYGPQPPEVAMIQESFVGAPNCLQTSSAYGEGKRLSELLCSLYYEEFGLACKIARCFAFAGPYLPADGRFAFGSFIQDALSAKSIQVTGDGTPVRSYLYAMDLAVWLWTILLRGDPAKAYNVGSENEVTIGQLAVEVSALLSPGLSVRIALPQRQEGKPARYVPSTRLAREELSLQEYTSRRESILRTAAWYRQSAAGVRS